MNTRPPDKTTGSGLEALIALLGRLEGLHHELRDALNRKLESMRGARLDDLHGCVQRERALTTRIGEQDGLRKQLMVQLGRGFGLSTDVARRLSARRLAERLAEPDRSRLNKVAARLKVAVEGVRKMNDLIGRVSARVLEHLDELFSSITAPEPDQVGYTQEGRAFQRGRSELFEAIG